MAMMSISTTSPSIVADPARPRQIGNGQVIPLEATSSLCFHLRLGTPTIVDEPRATIR